MAPFFNHANATEMSTSAVALRSIEIQIILKGVHVYTADNREIYRSLQTCSWC